jgi:uncharacterized protein (TIGR02453 family)
MTFPKETFDFLRDLEKNNKREWFEKNRDRYEQYWLAPAQAFVVDAGKALKKLDKQIKVEPKPGKSIMRIFRDIRFSKDKSPYKTHLDMWFSAAEHGDWGCPGYYVRLTAKEVWVGAGMHHFEKEALAKYRKAVDDDKTGKPLTKAIAAVEKSGLTVGSVEYKKVPRGFDEQHPRAELLKHGGLYADVQATPKDAKGDFVDYCMTQWKNAKPIYEWLRATL